MDFNEQGLDYLFWVVTHCDENGELPEPPPQSDAEIDRICADLLPKIMARIRAEPNIRAANHLCAIPYMPPSNN